MAARLRPALSALLRNGYSKEIAARIRFPQPARSLSSAAAPAATESAEAKMTRLLTDRLAAEFVEVKDVSGGCGSFYTVTVVSARFEGLSMIKQHRLVRTT